jgi:hypothetical protein
MAGFFQKIALLSATIATVGFVGCKKSKGSGTVPTSTTVSYKSVLIMPVPGGGYANEVTWSDNSGKTITARSDMSNTSRVTFKGAQLFATNDVVVNDGIYGVGVQATSDDVWEVMKADGSKITCTPGNGAVVTYRHELGYAPSDKTAVYTQANNYMNGMSNRKYQIIE